MTIDLDLLRATFLYEPETGLFFRRSDGKEIGYHNSKGYRELYVEGRRQLAHRMAWLYVYGVLPAEFLDHINHKRDDNRICNLREATNAQNQWNKAKPNGGVTWNVAKRKWRASISVNGKRTQIGSYVCKLDACAAAHMAALRYHGDFAKANFSMGLP